MNIILKYKNIRLFVSEWAPENKRDLYSSTILPKPNMKFGRDTNYTYLVS